MKIKTHIIVGTSAAGIGCASRLRALAPDDTIIVISQEIQLPYNTCLLADVLGGDRAEQQVYIKTQEFFAQKNIDLRLGVRVRSIDPQARMITCSDGNTLHYDTLFLGTGTSVQLPPIAGANNNPSTHFFHTLHDTQKLLAQLQNIKRAVIVGAGLSGVECTDALAGHGIAVDLVEMAPRLLPRQIDEQGSQVIEQCMRGVTLHKSTSVTQVDPKQVTLSTGSKLPYDALIFTTGGRPNISLAQQAGCKIEQGGIVVDEYMQTSVPHIYAGGDCATLHDQLTGGSIRSCLWPDAMQQGMHAAFAMAGQPKPYPGVCIISSSRFFDTVFVSCGPVVDVPASAKVTTESGDGFYHKFVHEGDRLIGFLQVGNVTNLGELRRQVLSAAPKG